MDTTADAGHPAGPDHSGGIVVGSALTLDEDLRQRVAAVAAEERGGAERFGSTRRILVEGAVWVALGIVIWLLAILVWG